MLQEAAVSAGRCRNSRACCSMEWHRHKLVRRGGHWKCCSDWCEDDGSRSALATYDRIKLLAPATAVEAESQLVVLASARRTKFHHGIRNLSAPKRHNALPKPARSPHLSGAEGQKEADQFLLLNGLGGQFAAGQSGKNKMFDDSSKFPHISCR